MNKKCFIVTLLTCLTVCLEGLSQPQRHVVFYDEDSGLPHAHVTQMLQDPLGFMWFATWNGLCRFDGYEFQTFKSTAGDGCQMTTDRFRDIALRPDGNIVCRVDDSYFLFETRTCQFRNMNAEEQEAAAADMKRYRMTRGTVGRQGFTYTDRQGNVWTSMDAGICKEMPTTQRMERLDITPQAEVKCLFKDRDERYWVCTKTDKAVRVYSCADHRLLGFLGPDGRLHQQYTRFGFAVYSMFQSSDGTLWLGTKPDGIVRLQETSSDVFLIDHFINLPSQNVYHMQEDRQGRLWVATMGGGLCYSSEPGAAHPVFQTPRGYPTEKAQRVRFLCLAQQPQQSQVLMAATTDGLVVSRLETDADKMLFRLHQRESDRAQGLSSSATMDIMSDAAGRYYVSTESGGINRIEGDNLLAEQLSFSHYTVANHRLPSDAVLSLTAMEEGGAMVVSSHLVAMVDTTGHYRQLDARYFNTDCRFTDAHPLLLGEGQWLFGLTDGAFMTTTEQMSEKAFQPQLVLTGISVQGGSNNRAMAYADTLWLQPDERSVTVHFAALDFSAPERISYAFRLSSDQWNYIGHDRSATLLDLEPGIYRMEIRSTNADGEWTDHVRPLTIVVQPTFWESAWGRLLMVLILAGVLATAAYTIFYIRHIKRQQHETLEAYLALINQERGRSEEQQTQQTAPIATDDPVIQRVMQFIEENIGNSEANVGEMAAAAAISRSGLQRKLKQTMGITPQDLLREARIKHACQLLRQTEKSVSEIAYACGFADPKYFSRCFKQSVGRSPSDYKNVL